jgi:hypothetical protein
MEKKGKGPFPNNIGIHVSRKISNPWNYDSPRYDERTSASVNAGRHFGIGERQPVGHAGDPVKHVDVLPQHTFQFNLYERDNLQKLTNIEENIIT